MKRGVEAAVAVDAPGCDRHDHRVAGVSPVMAFERREHVVDGKGVRRNPSNYLI